MEKIILLGVVLIFAWILWSTLIVRKIEEPRYQVLAKKNGYVIRKYDSYLIAETEVKGNYKEALNAGFRVIANYIFGNNTKQTAIAMTVPVTEQTLLNSEKIAMTVPVSEQEIDGNKHLISFTMPSKYTLKNLPKPNNSAVIIKEIPAYDAAVLRFSWYATAKRVEQQKRKLQSLLKKDGLNSLGKIQYAGYNPPFTIPFLQRHEILIALNHYKESQI